MANLTDQITPINDGKPIINPGPEGPSWVGGLANFAGAVLGGTLDRADRQEARSRQDQEDRIDKARDEFAGRLLTLNDTPNVFNAQSDISVTIPTWEQGQLRDRVETILSAEQQGAINASMRDVQFESLVSEMFQRYPDARAELSAMMQGMGLQHGALRDELARQSLLDADVAAREDALTLPARWAAERGSVTEGMSLVEQARVGRAGMAAAREAEAAAARAEAAREDRRLAREDQEAELDAAGSDMVAAIGHGIGAQIDPWMTRLGNMLGAARNNPNYQQMADEARTQTEIFLNEGRRRALAQIYSVGGAGVEDRVTQVNQMFDGYITQMNSMFDGSFEQNQRSVRNFADALGLETAQALPVYTGLVAAIGQGATNALLDSNGDGAIDIPQDILEGLSGEMRRFNPLQQDASARLARMVGYLRGLNGLEDQTPEGAREFFRANVTTQLGAQRSFQEGNQGALQNWLPMYINTTDAAVSMPVTADARSLHSATAITASRETRAMIDAIEDDETQRAVIQASRAGSQHLFEIAGRLPQSAGGWDIQYRNGSYQLIRPTRAEYEALILTVTIDRIVTRPGPDGNVLVPRNLPSYDEFLRQGAPDNIRATLDVLNGNLGHLAATRESEEWTRGLTERQYRDFVATGQLPEGFERPVEDASADAQFRNEFDDYMSDIRGASIEIQSQPTPPPPSRRGDPYDAVYGHGQYAQPPRPVTEMSIGEAHDWGQQVLVPATRGHLPNQDENTGTSAIGAYQFIGPTLARAAEAVFGADWRSVQFTSENQDRMGEWLFNNSRSSVAALRNEWEGLTAADAQRIVNQNLPWAQAREIIFNRESR